MGRDGFFNKSCCVLGHHLSSGWRIGTETKPAKETCLQKGIFLFHKCRLYTGMWNMFASTGLRARRGYMILRDHFRVGWIIIWSRRFEHEQRCMFLRSHLRDGLLPSSRSSACAAVALDDCCLSSLLLPHLSRMILWPMSYRIITEGPSRVTVRS